MLDADQAREIALHSLRISGPTSQLSDPDERALLHIIDHAHKALL
jgi:hypothetical protein